MAEHVENVVGMKTHFVKSALSEETIEGIRKLQNILVKRYGWSNIRTTNVLHLTLVVGGSDEVVSIDSIDEAFLEEKLIDFMKNRPPLVFDFGELECFNNNIIVIKLISEDEIQKFREELVEYLAKFGMYPIETDHSFTPHVTLCRARYKNQDIKFDVENVVFDPIPFDQIDTLTIEKLREYQRMLDEANKMEGVECGVEVKV